MGWLGKFEASRPIGIEPLKNQLPEKYKKAGSWLFSR
jgi:hypothetical protein